MDWVILGDREWAKYHRDFEPCEIRAQVDKPQEKFSGYVLLQRPGTGQPSPP